jgi:hypothetical protein
VKPGIPLLFRCLSNPPFRKDKTQGDVTPDIFGLPGFAVLPLFFAWQLDFPINHPTPRGTGAINPTKITNPQHLTFPSPVPRCIIIQTKRGIKK